MSKSATRATHKNNIRGASHPPAAGVRREPTLGAPIDVVTRRRSLYLPGAHLDACEALGITTSAEGYSKYLFELGDEIEADLEKFAVVFLAVFFTEEYKLWAQAEGVEADNAWTRRRYVAEMDIDDLVQVNSADEMFALVTSAALDSLSTSTAVVNAGEGSNEDDITEAIYDGEERGDDAYHQLHAFLEDVVRDHAIVTYVAVGLEPAGEETTMAGAVDVVRYKGTVITTAAVYQDLLYEVLRLGTSHRGGLMVRCCDDEAHDGDKPIRQTLYGWNLSSSGLKGMSEAETFNVACTAPDGDPIPPEEGVRYAGTDASRYSVDAEEPDDWGGPS